MKELEQLLWDKYGTAPDFSEARRQQLKEDRVRQAKRAGVSEAEILSKAEQALIRFYTKNDKTKIDSVREILDEFELAELSQLLHDKYDEAPDFGQVPGLVLREGRASLGEGECVERDAGLKVAKEGELVERGNENTGNAPTAFDEGGTEAAPARHTAAKQGRSKITR